ncbi:MAG TPA: hypothetical protein VFV38_33300 [Ktedonobacteraceae bacterium]|nr:hypothetical protein [Ktedonobacteraceae bacterium]
MTRYSPHSSDETASLSFSDPVRCWCNHRCIKFLNGIPPGGMVAELTIPEAGKYPLVTHAFADVGKGAVGMLKVLP